MLHNSGFVIVIIGLLAAVIVMWVGRKKKDCELPFDNSLAELKDRVERAEQRAQDVMNAERLRKPVTSFIGTYGPNDSEFLNKLKRFAELSDAQFMFEQLHRSVYEAALAATDDGLILNAVKKGKGIRIVERAVAAPLSLFGMTDAEADNGVD